MLCFIKAYRLRGDTDALLVAKAKIDICCHNLEAASLGFQAQHDSDKRSQLVANLDNILRAFEVLDPNNLSPTIFCEASDLLTLPPLSLDHKSMPILRLCAPLAPL